MKPQQEKKPSALPLVLQITPVIGWVSSISACAPHSPEEEVSEHAPTRTPERAPATPTPRDVNEAGERPGFPGEVAPSPDPPVWDYREIRLPVGGNGFDWARARV